MGETKTKEGGRLLTAEDIFRGGDEPYERLDIPELKVQGQVGFVYLKPPAANEVMAFAEKADSPDRNVALAELMAKSVVTPEGRPVFTADQARRLGETSIKVFNRIAESLIGDMGEGREGES